MIKPGLKNLLIIVFYFFVVQIGVAQDLTSGLVSVWEFEESSGNASDSHGLNYGTLVGIPTQNVSGKVGTAYDFDGANDYIDINSNSSLDISDEITLSCWIKAVNNGGAAQVFIGKPVSDIAHLSPYFAWSVHIFSTTDTDATIRFWISDGSVATSVSFTKSGFMGNWHHIVANYDGSYLNLYLDEVKVTESYNPNLTINTYDTKLRIGANGASGEKAKGLIDQVAIWNRALTATEISDLYNTGDGLDYLQWAPSTPLFGGTISPDSLTINSGEMPGAISSTAGASGGTGSFVYQWQESIDDGSIWTDISDETQTTYTPPALTQSTWFQRRVISGVDTEYSNVSKITISTSSSEGTGGSACINQLSVASSDITVTWPEEFSHNNYFLYVRAWMQDTIDGKSVQIQNGIYDFEKTVSGFTLKLKNPSGYLSYYAVDTINFDSGNLVDWTDTLSTIATKHDLTQFWSKAEITEADTARWGASGPETVSSVNGQTGTVVLSADDIDDSSTTNKFTTQTDIDRLANTSGFNTGNQDTTTITGLLEFVENHSTESPPETDPLFSVWDKTTGISITESQVSDLGKYLETEVDSSVTNEGSLSIGAGTASTSVIQSNTSGSTDVTLQAGSNITLAEAGNTITINGTAGSDYSVQALSGTTPTWNGASGVNATITLTANTTLTFSNLVAGQTGNLTATNAATAYTVTFAGYNILIAPHLSFTGDEITMTGSNLVDVLSWYYDGTNVIVNGTLGYQ